LEYEKHLRPLVCRATQEGEEEKEMAEYIHTEVGVENKQSWNILNHSHSIRPDGHCQMPDRNSIQGLPEHEARMVTFAPHHWLCHLLFISMLSRFIVNSLLVKITISFQGKG
jgi:hypothetical protein